MVDSIEVLFARFLVYSINTVTFNISLSSALYQKLLSEIYNYNMMLMKDTIIIDGFPLQLLLVFLFHVTVAYGNWEF